MPDFQVCVGDHLYWRKMDVVVVALPDADGKIVVKCPDGNYKLAKQYDVEFLPKHQFKAWWGQNDKNFFICKCRPDGSTQTMVIPGEILPDIRRVAFSRKQAIRRSMEPANPSIAEQEALAVEEAEENATLDGRDE